MPIYMPIYMLIYTPVNMLILNMNSINMYYIATMESDHDNTVRFSDNATIIDPLDQLDDGDIMVMDNATLLSTMADLNALTDGYTTPPAAGPKKPVVRKDKAGMQSDFMSESELNEFIEASKCAMEYQAANAPPANCINTHGYDFDRQYEWANEAPSPPLTPRSLSIARYGRDSYYASPEPPSPPRHPAHPSAYKSGYHDGSYDTRDYSSITVPTPAALAAAATADISTPWSEYDAICDEKGIPHVSEAYAAGLYDQTPALPAPPVCPLPSTLPVESVQTEGNKSDVIDSIPSQYKSRSVIGLFRVYYTPDMVYRYTLRFTRDIEDLLDKINDECESHWCIEIIALVENVAEINLIILQYGLDMVGCQPSDKMYDVDYQVYSSITEKKNCYRVHPSGECISNTDIYINAFYTINEDSEESYVGGDITELQHTLVHMS
jgi:hypothetical protein